MPEPSSTHNAPTEITAVAPVSTVVVGMHDRPYVDWSAVLGGAVVSLGLWTLLTSFGASVGLFVAPPWESLEQSATSLTIATAVWFAIVQLFVAAIGGYLAGRMRHRVDVGPKGEIEFRDGVNGLLVWGVGIFAAAMLAVLAGLTSVVAVSSANGTAASPASVDVVIDRLFRPAVAEAPADGEAAAGQSITIIPRQPDRSIDRQEITRMLETPEGSEVTVSPADRAYLAALVASRTNLNRSDAEARVNQTLNEWRAERKEAWEKARSTAALLGFWTVAILLVSAGAAWWAATLGGTHRDDFE